ncbi:MAG: monofunctional biosynthetic peptidoglycan transglycosylase [Bacteroidota bacterium]|nr:monofunctional biosynthetic peptidoglycan transglycosylase [Bacteroidota bacterium]
MLKRIKNILKSICLFVFQTSLLAIIIYRVLPVAYTPLMLLRYIQNADGERKNGISKEWKPLYDLGREVPLSALTGEDPKFFNHFGFDFKQIRHAAENNMEGGKTQGASTISQQTAKNLFLLPMRSYIRKGLEVYFTALMELVWSKRRILEVYLNIIETGPAIFGVEAASQKYFKKLASKLNVAQSARLIAVLPNPRRWHPDNLGYDFWDKCNKPNIVLNNHYRAIIFQRGYVQGF